MDLTFLQYTDQQLVEMAEVKSTTKEAKREIARRKRVGWRLIANWQPEKEAVQEERVYAPGVKRR